MKHQIKFIQKYLNSIISSFVFLLFLFNSFAMAKLSTGAISSGMAGAGNSSVDLGESYLLNPGSIAHLRGAGITIGNSSYHSATKEPNKNQFNGWYLTLNEFGSDSMFATSIYVGQSQLQQKYNLEFPTLSYNDTRLTIGNFILPGLSAGISYQLHSTATPFRKFQENGFSLGFLWTMTESFGFGFSAQNLASTVKNDIPDFITLGTSTGLGFLYIYENYLRLRLDLNRTMHKLESQSMSEWALGLENMINHWILTRIGIARSHTLDHTTTQKLSFGIGFAGPRFGIHYALQQYQISQNGQEHSVDFVIPF